MAMAEMMRIMATTISNSIKEKPVCFFMSTPKLVIITECGGACW
jgi:hypothetical protein